MGLDIAGFMSCNLELGKTHCHIVGFQRLVMRWSYCSCVIYTGRKEEIVIKDIVLRFRRGAHTISHIHYIATPKYDLVKLDSRIAMN